MTFAGHNDIAQVKANKFVKRYQIIPVCNLADLIRPG
jgi:hypothetical protein